MSDTTDSLDRVFRQRRSAFGQFVRNLRRSFDDVADMVALNCFDDGINCQLAIASTRDDDGQLFGKWKKRFDHQFIFPTAERLPASCDIGL